MTILSISLALSFATARRLLSSFECAERIVTTQPFYGHDVRAMLHETEANVCRKACYVIPFRPARLAAFLRPSFTSLNRSPVSCL